MKQYAISRPAIRCLTQACVILGTALTLVAGARAGSILQDQSNSSRNILACAPLGQTFTAIDPYLTSVGLWVYDPNPGGG